jgi:hypothetical protein
MDANVLVCCRRDTLVTAEADRTAALRIMMYGCDVSLRMLMRRDFLYPNADLGVGAAL